MSIYRDQKVLCIYVYLHNKEKLFSILSNSKVNLFRTNLTKDGPTCRDKWLIHGPNITRTTSHIAWNTAAECPRWDVTRYKEFQSNEFSLVFSKVQGHPTLGRCVIVDTLVWHIYSVSIISNLWHMAMKKIKAIIWYRTICAWKRQATIASIRHGFN